MAFIAPILDDHATREALARVVGAVRTVHRELLESTRRAYERLYGRVQSPAALFDLASRDPAFAWLKPLLNWMARLDARLEEPLPIVDAERDRLVGELRGLLVPGASPDDGFANRYVEALQASPDLALAHVRLKALLPNPGPRN